MIDRETSPAGGTPAHDFPLLIRNLFPNYRALPAEREIVDSNGRRFSYRDLWARIGKLANTLQDLGVRCGDTVAVLDWDSHRYLEAYYAIPAMGCVLLTVNIRLSSDAQRYCIDHSGATVVISHKDFLPVLLEKPLANVRRIVPIGTPPCDVAHGIEITQDFYALTDAASAAFAYPDLAENERATIFYTSGTTGLPKGVLYSHRQIFLHTLAVLATFGTAPAQGRFGANDVYMPITPLFHAHAWGFPYAATLIGAKQVYPGRYQPEALLQLIAKEGVTFVHCVASILHMMLTHETSRYVDLSRMKVLIGGGPLPEGLARQALERGIDIFAGYGMSEAGPIQAVNHLTPAEAAAPADQQPALRISAGRPFLLCDVQTVDSDLRPTPPGVPGEVVFRAPWLTSCYWRDPEGSAALWEGECLHSQDIGSFNESGVLRITDRLKDVIKTGGEWVSSQLLESLISRINGVIENAVIAVPDARWGERPMALVVRKDENLTAAEIAAELTEQARLGIIPRYAVPEKISFIENLDRTSVGKIDKVALRRRFAS